jgi:hypothetical protein
MIVRLGSFLDESCEREGFENVGFDGLVRVFLGGETLIVPPQIEDLQGYVPHRDPFKRLT